MHKRVRAALILALASFGARATAAQQCPIAREYWPTAGWRTASPGAQSVDSAQLDSALTQFGEKTPDVYAVMVVRHGYVVGERFYHEHEPAEAFDMRSATKSIVSMLTGIAIEQHLLRGVDQPVSSFVPEYFNGDSVDARKTRITIRHLLTMTSGLDWDELHASSYYTRAPSWAPAILSRPMAADPGRKFIYSSGNAHLLSVAITRAAHRSTLDFANDNLFHPLGFTLSLFEWLPDPSGVNGGGAGLRLTLPQMAKLGYLYLNSGCWDGTAVVPAKWVAQSTKKWSDPGKGSAGYGFLWWLSTVVPGAYSAIGAGGQYIFIDPLHDAVIAIAADPAGEGGHFAIVKSLVIPALH